MSEGYNYRSNLEAPDLRPYFKHTWERVTPQSYGHLVLSDFYDKPADDPVFAEWRNICGFWTLDEAAILYNCARQMNVPLGGIWLDIGAHTGWTTAHLLIAGAHQVVCVDPMFRDKDFYMRFGDNVANRLWDQIYQYPQTANDFFAGHRAWENTFDGAVIDGNHSSPCPLEDAQNSAKHLKDRGIILLHDYRGEPIKEAYRWLLANGFQGRTYTTPNGVAVCWRGEFTPPEHVPDPALPPV